MNVCRCCLLHPRPTINSRPHPRRGDLAHVTRARETSPMSGQRVAVAATGAQSLAAGLGVAAEGGGRRRRRARGGVRGAGHRARHGQLRRRRLRRGLAGRRRPGGRRRQRRDARPRRAPTSGFGSGVREVFTTYGGGVTMHAGAGSVATPGIVPGVRGRARERCAGCRGRGCWRRPTARRPRRLPDEPGRRPATSGSSRDSLFGEDPEAHALMTRRRRHRAGRRRGDAQPGPGRRARRAGRPRAPSLFTTGRVGRALVDAMRRRRAGHGGRPRGVLARGARPRTRSPSATGPSRSTRRRRWAVRSSR